MQALDPIRVSLMHSDPFTQAGLEATFAKYGDLRLSSAQETAVIGQPSQQPWCEPCDVLVTDFASGVEIARQSARLYPPRQLKIVVIDTFARECDIRKALELGIQGYVVIGCGLDHLVGSVRSVYHGLVYLMPDRGSEDGRKHVVGVAHESRGGGPPAGR